MIYKFILQTKTNPLLTMADLDLNIDSDINIPDI